MAFYSDFITKLRADVGDYPLRRYETADGDASTSLFQLANAKILESSYTVKVGGATQTETTIYSMNKDVGQVLFTTGNIPAAGSDNVSFEYQSVNLLDADWIDIINQVLQKLRRKLWIELTDETTLTTVADQFDYATSGIAADIVHLLDIEYRPSSTEMWRSIRSVTNAMFYKDLQKLHLRPAFNTTGFAIRVRANRAYVQGTTASSTFEPQEKYWPVIRKFCQAEYLNRRAMEMAQETGAVSKEKAFENMTEMLKLAQMSMNSAEILLKQVKPQKPALVIPQVIAGIKI